VFNEFIYNNRTLDFDESKSRLEATELRPLRVLTVWTQFSCNYNSNIGKEPEIENINA